MEAVTLLQDGSTSIVHFAKRRCCNLGCEYVANAPKEITLLPCEGKCGIMFCCIDCRDTHFYEGHYIACPNIKKANERKRNIQKTEVEEREEKYCLEVKRCSDFPIELLKIQLMAKHVSLEAIQRMTGKKELVNAVARAEVDSAFNFKPMTDKEAQETMRHNMLLPSVFYRGKVFYRRFRVGQRVLCSQYGNHRAAGTIIKVNFDPSFGNQHDSELLPYEIETDEGFYMHAPADCPMIIDREGGSHVVSDGGMFTIFTDKELVQQVKKELDSGFQYCVAARSLYDKGTKASPKLDKRRCCYCGIKANVKLSICSVCHTSAYCNRKCQKKHWARHKETCEAIRGERAKFLEDRPYAKETKEGKNGIRVHSINVKRFHEVMDFFTKYCGLPYGGARQLQNIMIHAVDATLKDDVEQQLCKLACRLEEDILAVCGQMVLTSDNLLRLIAGVVHFYDTDRELAAWCVAGVDLFFQVSFNRAVVPRTMPPRTP